MQRINLLLAFVVMLMTLALASAATPDPLKTQPTFPAEATVRFVLVGDSTVTDDAGWGRGFAGWLNNGAACINLSRGGRSSGSFIKEGRWQQALDLKPDYVLIQFGHNDQPGHGPDRESDPATTYRANMAKYVDDALAAGIKPILVTPLSRRQWDKEGLSINSGLAPYADAVRQLATEKKVPLIDLHDRSIDFYLSLGRDSIDLISPTKENGDLDGTHLNFVGGASIGEIVAYDLRAALPETDRYLNNWKGRPTTAPTTNPSTAPATTQPRGAESTYNTPAATTSHQGEKQFTAAADGSGDFRTIQQAIAAIPDGNLDRTTLRIGPGVYHGCIILPRSKINVSFIGEDAQKTIITYALNVADPQPREVPRRIAGTGVIILGEGFIAENLTFRNTSGDHGQAMALRLEADKCILRNCRLLGWQDTLRLHSKRQYLVDSYIEGRVDFIYGGSTAVLERCTIKSKNGGYVTAASTPQEEPYGFVFLNCKLISDDKVPTLLGRPWRPYAHVAFVRCELGAHIKPEGWDNWGKAENESTARYAEYGCTGPGADRSKRVAWTRELTEAEAAKLTTGQVLAGKDRWNPTSP